MKNTITIILGMILLLANISAIDIIAGESKTIQLPEPYLYYTITDNQTEIDLTIINNGLNVTITPNKYLPNCNFTITFYNGREEVIGSSGRGAWSDGGFAPIKPAKIIPVNETIPLINQTIETPIIIPEEPAAKEFFLWTWLKWIWNKLIFWKK